MKSQVSRIITKVLYIFGVCIIIALFQICTSIFSAFHHFYFFTFYPAFSSTWRLLTGWCPFSIGDIIYVIVAVWLISGGVLFIKNLLRLQKDKLAWLHTLLRFLLIVVVAYGIFIIFWGMNYRYNRLQKDFQINALHYPAGLLVQLCDTLAARANEQHLILAGNDTLPVQHFLTFRQIKKEVPKNYERIAKIFPQLKYVHPSIKPSMFGYLMDYPGVTGYYNPFTGEAQVNTTPFPVGLPFTACHEVAHQLGFAAEEDANFVGYLVASTSPDPYFRYAANFEMFLYGINVLSWRDPHLADSLWKTLVSSGVHKDYEKDFEFYDRFKTSFRPMLNDMYDQYLKANEQSKGIRSYDEVISLLINYIQKNGKLPGY